VPLSIAGQMLAKREINAPGVLCPEIAVRPERFFSELARRGMTVRFEMR
jgi:saccharopine dehydrogenase-like NADP-dependent oxidoreductase